MSASVWAIVVTYNRKALLAECLEALRSQTRACDRILIIDNASTDGTADWLGQTVGGNVQAYQVSRNTGGAGGFNAGMRIAYQGGADHLWLMDDDVIPKPDALEKLLQASEALDARGVDHAFVASTAWTPEGLLTNVPDLDHRSNAIDYANWATCLDLTMVAVRRSTFVSILLPRAKVAAYGLPIAPMFIWGDDSEYTVRVTASVPGFLVGASAVTHVRAAPGVLSLKTESNPVRMTFHRYLTRNTAYLVRTHYGRRRWLAYCLEQIEGAIGHAVAGRFKKAGILVAGVWDSMRFHPPVERGEDAGWSLDAQVTAIGPVA